MEKTFWMGEWIYIYMYVYCIYIHIYIYPRDIAIISPLYHHDIPMKSQVYHHVSPRMDFRWQALEPDILSFIQAIEQSFHATPIAGWFFDGNSTWAIKNTPIPSHYTSWLIGFPLWAIIIPSKPGSIIPYSNQFTRVFLMAHLEMN